MSESVQHDEQGSSLHAEGLKGKCSIKRTDTDINIVGIYMGNEMLRLEPTEK